MATWVGIGSSRISDSFRAGEEAASQARQSMGQPTADWLLVFASVRFEPEPLLKGIGSVFLEAPLVGCSTAGEILGEGPSRRSVVVMAIRSDSLRIATGLSMGISKNPQQAGRDLATRLNQQRIPNPHGLLIFPDGLTGNVADLIRGIQDILGLSFPIVGGSSADDFAFRRTYQFFQGQVFTDAAVGVLLAGPIRLGIGARHGWQPLGKPRRVTKATGNVVREMDGHSAVNLYETYFGKAAASLPAGGGSASGGKTERLADMSILYPLGMPIPGEEEYLLRNVLRVDPDDSLVYAGEVPEGSEVRLMMGSKQKAMEAARLAAEQAARSIAPHSPRFGLVFSSCSRARLFGRQAAEEIASIQRTLGPTVPLAGFYDYGEQAPMTATQFRGRSHFHNESVVVVAISAT